MHINIGIQKRDELINRNVDKIVKQRKDEKTQQLMLERMQLLRNASIKP